MAIFEFIEGWYNPHRRHFALDYQFPHQLREEPVAPALIAKAVNCPPNRGQSILAAGANDAEGPIDPGGKTCKPNDRET